MLTNDVSGADTPKSFVAWDAAGNAVEVAALGTYGTLLLNGDGTWSFTLNNALATTQALAAGETKTYTLGYTMQDADLDQDDAILTITITGAGDSATVVTAALNGPDQTVYEAGLNPNGSAAAGSSETVPGSFTVSATDGMLNVVIGGTTFTFAQVQAFNGTQTVNTGEGVLTLLSYTGTSFAGTVAYSYTLSATIDNDTKFGATATDFDDSIALTVNGIGGTTANDSLVIRIIDDVPLAVDDGPSAVVEDAGGALNTPPTSLISGNVLTNDVSGADTPKSFVAWDAAGNAVEVAALGTYGTLLLNGDGTWSFTLNNALATTQALAAGETKTYTLGYTMQDADLDQDDAILTITITGAGDSATVVTAALNGPDQTVYEAGLNPNGSAAAGSSETVPGSFTVSATDGMLNVVIGGTTFTFAQVQAFNGTQTVNTGEGVLTLLSYTGTSFAGTVAYSYTLSATIDNDTKFGATATDFDDSIALTVNGIGGTTANDSLVIRIIDDVPLAVDDGPAAVVEDAGGALNTPPTSLISGNVLTNDVSGADTPKSFVAWDAAGNAVEVAALGTYGTLLLNGDGTWSFTLNNALATTQALAAGETKTYTLGYTMQDADLDQDDAILTITITGAGDSATVVTAALNGPDQTVYEAGLNPNGSAAAGSSETVPGSFTVSATDGMLNVVIGGTTFTFAQVQAFNGTQTVNTGEGVLTLLSYTGTSFAGTVAYSYTLSATIDNDTKFGATATDFDDSIALTVNGIGGTTANDNLVIRIIDDVPLATDDGSFAVVEDGTGALNTPPTSLISGNVLTNDVSGADTPKSFVAWDAAGNAVEVAALGTYGTLLLNGDGTWSFTLNNALATTQALAAGETKTYTLGYTMQDADLDQDDAILTITITGAGDSATVVTAALNGPDQTVYEAGLNPNGSAAAGSSETVPGSFTVSATDGMLNVVIGGTTFTFAQVQAFNGTQTVNTGEGVLTLLSYTGTSFAGTVAYSYTLSATIDNDTKFGATATDFDDSIALTVNGIGGTTANDSLVIRIIDDVPINNDVTVAVNVAEDTLPGGNLDAGSLLTTTATITAVQILGLVTAGADAPVTIGLNALIDGTASGLTQNNVPITWDHVSATQVNGVVGGNVVFTLVKSGADYVFTLLANVDHTLGVNSTDLETVTLALANVFTATDADGDVVVINAGASVTIENDIPKLETDDLSVYRTVGITSGEYEFDVGADTANFTTSFPTGSLVWSNIPSGYTFALKAGSTDTYAATFLDGATTKTYFEIKLNSNGTYDFNLIDATPDITVDSGAILSTVSGGSGLASYTFPSTIFGGAFALVLTGTKNGNPSTLTISNADLGIAGNSIQGSDVLKLDIQQQVGYESSSLANLTLAFRTKAASRQMMILK